MRDKCLLYRIFLLLFFVGMMPAMSSSQVFKHYEGIANKQGDYEVIDASKGCMRQKTHECHYYVPVKEGGSVSLNLPIEDFASNGSPLEPRGFFRWYNYDTDCKSEHLQPFNPSASLLREIMDDDNRCKGLVAYSVSPNATRNKVGVYYVCPSDANWKGEVIACDVSRYVDGMENKKFSHEPTLSMRYIFHVIPARQRADAITEALRLGLKSKANDLTFEDNKEISVGLKSPSSTMNIRLNANELDLYYFHPLANPDTHHVFCNDEKYQIQPSDLTDTTLVQPTQIRWRIYDSTKSKYCWYTKPASKPESRFMEISLDLLNGGKFNGWHKLNGAALTSAAEKPTFNYGDKVYVVAMAMNGNYACPIANYTITFYNHYPITFEQLHNDSHNTRMLDYLNEHYRSVATVSFDDDDDEMTLEKPTNPNDNQDRLPSRWSKRSYGFVYRDLIDKTSAGRNKWEDPKHSPIHGEYGLYKSANLSGVSGSGDTFANQYLWYQGATFYDRTYQQTNGSQYGHFLYIDAADESRQIAEVDFKANLCVGSQVVFSSAIADMTSNNIKPEVMFKLYGVHYDENNQETDRKLLHSFSTGYLQGNVDQPYSPCQWYQCYGKMVLQKESGVSNYEDFKIVVDNLCKGTKGADYAFDDLRVYTQASKVNVLQSSPICPDVDTEKNPLAPTTVRLKIRALQETMTALDSHAQERKVYFRFVNADGSPTTDVNYGTQAEPNRQWGYATIYNNVDESRKVDGEPMYEKVNDEWNVVLANRYFGLQSNKTYYLSLAIDDETIKDKNLLSWGKPSDVCSLYSEEFQMVQQKVVVNDTNGNIATSVTIPCDEHATPEYDINAQLQTVDQNNGGSINLSGVLFDWYVDRDTVPLVKSSNSFQNIPLSVGEHTIRVMPCSNSTIIQQGGVAYEICLDEMSFKLRVVKNGPRLDFGASGVVYPQNYTPTVRLGLPQVKLLAAQYQAGKGGYLSIPVSGKNFIADNSTQLDFVEDAGKNSKADAKYTDIMYLSDTNDPAYQERLGSSLHLAQTQQAYIDRNSNQLSVRFFSGDATDGKAVQLHEGYWYEGMLIFRENGSKGTTVLCAGEAYVRFEVVPEFLSWNPTASNNMSAAWNNDQNWRRSSGKELYRSSAAYTDDEAALGYVPMKFTKVTIPNLSGLYYPSLAYIAYRKSNGIATKLSNAKGDAATENIQYALMAKWDALAADHGLTADGNLGCEPFYGNTCDEIYFKPGGELLGQSYLIYNKVWTEKEMEPNTWYVLTSPLKDTYAGDMFVPAVGGRQETEAFQPISYSENDNSRIQSPVYQRSWDSQGSEQSSLEGTYDAYDFSGTGIDFDKQTLYQVSSHWSHVYNQLDKAYAPMEGFALKMGDKYTVSDASQQMLLRLPKADTHYSYYDASQTDSGNGVDVDKQEAYRFVVPTEVSEDALGSMSYPLVRLSDDNEYYLVGNPYMATLSMYKFLKANPQLASIFYTYEDGEIRFYDSIDMSLGTYDSKNDVTIAPMQAFFVRVADGQQLQQLSFTSSMTIDREVLGTRNMKQEARYVLTPNRSATGIDQVEVMPLSGKVRVFAVDGRLVYQNPSASAEEAMHHLSEGCYIIQVTAPGGECHSVKISVK